MRKQRRQARRITATVVSVSVMLTVLWRVVTLIYIAFTAIKIDNDEDRQPQLLVANVQSIGSNSTRLVQPVAKGRLKNDWSNNVPRSPMAIEMLQHQSNCSLPVTSFHMDNDFGLGSHLTLWSQAMCNAMSQNARLRTINPVWLWMDQTLCDRKQAEDQSPLLCYFPKAEFLCGDDGESNLETANISDPRMTRQWCPFLRQANPRKIVYEPKLADFRAASIEFLFRNVSPIVIQEAERQSGILFGPNGSPSDLITVHMRWGDKFWEMDLPPAEEYIKGVSDLLQMQGRDNNETANIYLATEDPQAKDAFLEAAPPGWNIYVDRTIEELDDYRPPKGNRASHTTRNTKGRAGLVAMGSLLVAMEAKYFVLTTKSNWSRVMDFLRTNIIDPKCGNCTRMIDLRPGIW